MDAKQAANLGGQIAGLVTVGELDAAWNALQPVLEARTPFRLLDKIGAGLGTGPIPESDGLLEEIAASRLMGGWVVIASTLGARLGRDMGPAIQRCREYAVLADVWYAADIMGERVAGPALRLDFSPAVELLSGWQTDPNRWVLRMTGVAVHFWAKRSRGVPSLSDQARALLAFLEPLFEESNPDVVKGVGWGLKSLGRWYPQVATDWLEEQVVRRGRSPRALMLRKALTYLPEDLRRRVTRGEA